MGMGVMLVLSVEAVSAGVLDRDEEVVLVVLFDEEELVLGDIDINADIDDDEISPDVDEGEDNCAICSCKSALLCKGFMVELEVDDNNDDVREGVIFDTDEVDI